MVGYDPAMAEGKAGVGSVIVLILAVGWFGSQCSGSSSSSSSKSSSSKPTTSTPAAKAPYEHQHMPGDGYHNIGGIDGKDWGTWQSTGSAKPCSWSIRLTDPYGPATVLREGTADPGRPARVTISPPGDVSSISGVVKATGGRVVFQTFGCGAWTVK